MSTPKKQFTKFSRAELIGTIQKLEASLAEAAKGLMTGGSRQELEQQLTDSYKRNNVLERELGDALAKTAFWEQRSNEWRELAESMSMVRIPRFRSWWNIC